MAGIFVFETEMVDKFAALTAERLVFDSNTGEVTSEIGLHKTLAITWNSFLEVF